MVDFADVCLDLGVPSCFLHFIYLFYSFHFIYFIALAAEIWGLFEFAVSILGFSRKKIIRNKRCHRGFKEHFSSQFPSEF